MKYLPEESPNSLSFHQIITRQRPDTSVHVKAIPVLFIGRSTLAGSSSLSKMVIIEPQKGLKRHGQQQADEKYPQSCGNHKEPYFRRKLGLAASLQSRVRSDSFSISLMIDPQAQSAVNLLYSSYGWQSHRVPVFCSQNLFHQEFRARTILILTELTERPNIRPTLMIVRCGSAG